MAHLDPSRGKMIPTSELDRSVDQTISDEYRANGDHNPHFNEKKDHHHPEGAEQGFTGNLELKSDEDVESDSTMSDIESEEEEEDDEFVDHAEEVLDRQKHHEDIIGGVHHLHHHHHHYHSRKNDKEDESRGRDALSPAVSHKSMSMGGSLPDGEQLSPRQSAISGIVRSDTTDSRREDSPDMLTHKSKHKTFTFGMPFSNPLANKEAKKGKKKDKIKRASTFGSVFNKDEDEAELAKMDSATQAEHESIAQIRQKLNRNLSITTEEEDKLFGNKHDLQSVRVNKIVSNATMPTVVDSLKIGNKQKLSKHDPFNALEGDFVILGGYRGSVLRDAKTKRRVWIPIKVGFNLRKIDLTVGTSDDHENNMEKTIYPDGMLTHIGPIDLSKRLIQKISYNPKCRIRDFGYDWRLDIGLNARKLIEFLEKIYAENGNKKITVMAHSMGGLVTHKAMLLRPDLFKGVLYLGSPSECPAIIGPIKNGDAVLLSSKVLTAQVNFLMRSSFIFLPEDKQLFVDKNTGQRIDIDFYNPEEWKKYALSPCVSEEHRQRCLLLKKGKETSGLKPSKLHPHEHHHHGFGDKMHKLASVIAHPREHKEHFENMHPEATGSGADAMAAATGHSGQVTMGASSGNNDNNIPTIDYDDACNYLERTLKRTKALRASFWYDEARKDEYPPLACVVGTTVPTLKACRVDGFDGLYKGDFSDFVLGSGDGVVYSKWNMPEPFGFKVVAKVKTNRGHVGLMTDHVAVAKALIALQDAADKRAKGESYLPDITPVHSIPVTDEDSGASTPVHSAPSSTMNSPAPGHNPQFSSPLKHAA
ncbi:hypothetical protein CJU89_1206 [Yarrowia sp. B02]|nr:hypothetical protein CJU89_1206 [Yarrowia sp. B02]